LFWLLPGGWGFFLPVPRPNSNPAESIVSNLLAWYRGNARDLPWRRTRSPYGIWVSEIMLQQTQVKTVIPYWNRWMEQLPDVASLANVPEARLLKLWEGLGYYRRARNLQKAALFIMEEMKGRFPREHDEILKLPGVGRYTAGAISSIAYDRPEALVDGNVIRVLSRLFAKAGDPKSKEVGEWFWSKAGELVAEANATRRGRQRPCSDFNQSLMELGATICTPAKPSCLICPVRGFCEAQRKGMADRFPETAKRAEATERLYAGVVVWKGKKVFVRQRAGDAVNGGFWEFPNIEVGTEGETAGKMADWLGVKGPLGEPVLEVRFSITRYRNLLKVFELQKTKTVSEEALADAASSWGWHTLEQLEDMPFTSAQRKVKRFLETR